MDVDVQILVGGQSGGVAVVDRVASGSEDGDDVVEVDGVPEGDAVEDEAEGTELVFRSGVVGLVEFAFAAVEDVPAEPVASFLEVPHVFDLPPVGGVLDEGEDVHRFEDPPVVGDGVAEAGESAVVLQDTDDVMG